MDKLVNSLVGLELDFMDFTDEDLDMLDLIEAMIWEDIINFESNKTPTDMANINTVIDQSFKDISYTYNPTYPWLTRLFTRLNTFFMTDKTGVIPTPTLTNYMYTRPYIAALAINLPRFVYESLPYSLRSFPVAHEWHADRELFDVPHHIHTIVVELAHKRPPTSLDTIMLCGRWIEDCVEWEGKDFPWLGTFLARLWLTMNGYDPSPSFNSATFPLLLLPLKSKGKDIPEHKENYIWNILNRLTLYYE